MREEIWNCNKITLQLKSLTKGHSEEMFHSEFISLIKLSVGGWWLSTFKTKDVNK